MARKDEKNVEKGQEKKPKTTKYTRGIPVAYSVTRFVPSFKSDPPKSRH
jgi:hypothetical protein